MILDKGTLNSKLEYGINQICRLGNCEAEWKTADEQRRLWEERRAYNKNLAAFIVIKSENKHMNVNSTPFVVNHVNCSRFKNKVAQSRKRRQQDIISNKEGPGAKCRRMESSTPVHKETARAENIDPDLESPILAIAPNYNGNEHDNAVGMLVFNESTDGESYQDHEGGAEGKRMKTNISDDLLASKIGSVKSINNNSSLEYAIGAECLQAAAITTGILNEEGAAVGHEQALTEAPAGEPSIDHYEGININTWNSSSTFSN